MTLPPVPAGRVPGPRASGPAPAVPRIITSAERLRRLLALVPAAVAALQLVRLVRGDPRPASIALWGVVLYATTATGLAVVFAMLAP